MIFVLEWWFISTIFGIATLPIVWRIFHRLPDRGFGFARTLGLLSVGYVLWLAASIKWLQNTIGGILIAIGVVAVFGFTAGRGRWLELGDWLRSKRRTILTMEVVFSLGFAFWALVRAANPEISGTEKPMELAFVNAILGSESFPPRDPWLSGYAISYYYFGYVFIAILTRFSSVPSGVAFNLTNSMWFGLSLVGAYSILYNLIHWQDDRRRIGAPLLGPLFVVVSGNLEGVLEVLHARHFLWRTGPDGSLTSRFASGFDFWGWLGIKNLVDPPLGDPSWLPIRHWWWWRASRVVNDVNLAAQEVEVIDEFPFFSFLLADNHPHVLALPFILLLITFSLQVFLGPKREPLRFPRVNVGDRALRLAIYAGVALLLGYLVWRGATDVAALLSAGSAFISLLKTALVGFLVFIVAAIFLSVLLGRTPLLLPGIEFWFAAWSFGSLLFINTWDFPIYFVILVTALIWSARKLNAIDISRHVGMTSIALAAAGVIFYLPWFPTFASQAGGILPNLIFPTKFRQFFVMFAPAFIPLAVWLGWKLIRGGRSKEILPFLSVTVGLPLLLFLLALLLSGIIAYALPLQDPLALADALRSLGVTSVQQAWRVMLQLRARYSWTAIGLGAVFSSALLVIFRHWRGGERPQSRDESVQVFVLVLLGIGTLLILGPEFLYLRDQFGTRMNTVFKFYFTAWILWGLAAAYATFELFQKPEKKWIMMKTVVILPLIVSMVYPVLGTWTKTQGFRPAAGYNLDGTAYLAQVSASDQEAIAWVKNHLPIGTIVEAVGGSYSYYGRVSTHTGFPTVLGWPGHESQWRGGAIEQGSRGEDVRLLYQTRNWNEAAPILERYDVDYIYVGELERRTYTPVYEQKFEVFMERVYQQGDVVIYARPGEVRP
jgi:uncharacterized membrane protein